MRPSAGVALATLALIVAASGTTLAAHRYLITSTSQIAPKVRTALRAARGPQGLPGPRGATGSIGPASVKVVTNSGPNTFPSSTSTVLATSDLSSGTPAAHLAIATLDVDVFSGYVTCVLSTYGAATAANDDATVTSGTQRLTLQIPVVSTSGGSFGATLGCTTGASTSADHQFVTLSAIETGSLTTG